MKMRSNLPFSGIFMSSTVGTTQHRRRSRNHRWTQMHTDENDSRGASRLQAECMDFSVPICVHLWFPYSSTTPLPGLPVQRLPEQVPQPHGEQTDQDRRRHVGESVKHLPLLRQLERLEAEGREGCVSAAEP